MQTYINIKTNEYPVYDVHIKSRRKGYDDYQEVLTSEKPTYNTVSQYVEEIQPILDNNTYYKQYVVRDHKQETIDGNLTKLKTNQIEKLKQQFEDQLNVILSENPISEKLSWDKQEKEARGYILDETILTPYLDALLVARGKGETKAELVSKIIAKSDMYVAFHASLLGNLHKKINEVNAVTVEDYLKINSITLVTSDQSTTSVL